MLTTFPYFPKKQWGPPCQKFIFSGLAVPVISVIVISSWAVLLCLSLSCRSLKVWRVCINIPIGGFSAAHICDVCPCLKMMPSGGAQAYCWLVEGLLYISGRRERVESMPPFCLFPSLSHKSIGGEKLKLHDPCTAESQLPFSKVVCRLLNFETFCRTI